MRSVVAPYMGAWIEILSWENQQGLLGVAPYMGAWIEIYVKLSIDLLIMSRSLHGSVD